MINVGLAQARPNKFLWVQINEDLDNQGLDTEDALYKDGQTVNAGM